MRRQTRRFLALVSLAILALTLAPGAGAVNWSEVWRGTTGHTAYYAPDYLAYHAGWNNGSVGGVGGWYIYASTNPTWYDQATVQEIIRAWQASDYAVWPAISYDEKGRNEQGQEFFHQGLSATGHWHVWPALPSASYWREDDNRDGHFEATKIRWHPRFAADNYDIHVEFWSPDNAWLGQVNVSAYMVDSWTNWRRASAYMRKFCYNSAIFDFRDCG